MFAHIVGAVLVHLAAALGALAQAGLRTEVHRLTGAFVLLRVFAEVELHLPVGQLFVAHHAQLGREGPTRLRAEAFQRTNLAVTQQLLHLVQLKAAARRDLGHAEATTGRALGIAAALARAGEAAVVFLDHTAAVRAGRAQGRVVARNGVAVVFLGLLHHALRHGSDLGHEGLAAQATLFHLRQLEFPVAGQLGLGQVFHPQAAQQRHQLEGLGRGDHLAPLTVEVLLGDQAFDDGRAGGRCAQPLLGHRRLQLLVVDQLACAFHGTQQRRFRVAGRRLGLQGTDQHVLVAHGLARLHGHQRGVVALFGRFLAVHGHPARLDQHLAVRLKVVHLVGHRHLGDAGGDHELGRRVEHRNEALDHHVVQLGLGLGEAAGGLHRRDDGKVVRHLGVVENALVGLDVALAHRLAGMRGQSAQRAGQLGAGDHRHRVLDHRQVVFRQRTRIGSRIRQGFVLFIQRLRQRQRGLGTEAKARVRLTLQRGQVVQQRAGLRAGLGLFRHGAGLAAHRIGNRLRLGRCPDAVRLQLGVLRAFHGILDLLELRVEPLAVVTASGHLEAAADFPVIAEHVLADLFFALHHDGQRGRLHPAHGGQEKAPIARVERRHRPRAIDAHQPVGLGAATRGTGQRQHLLIGAQGVKAVADGLRRHALQPQAAHVLAQALGTQRGGAVLRVLRNQAEDQLPFAPRVTRVDQGRDVLALDQLDQGIEAPLALVDRVQIEMRRDHRQVRETPLAAFDIELFRRLDLDQVADGGADHIVLALEVFVVFLELAIHRRQRAHDVLGNRRFFCNDQGFAHGRVYICKPFIQSGFSRAHTRAPAHFNINTLVDDASRAQTHARRPHRRTQRQGRWPGPPHPGA